MRPAPLAGVRKLLVGCLFLPDGLRRRTELHRGGISDLSEPALAGMLLDGTQSPEMLPDLSPVKTRRWTCRL